MERFFGTLRNGTTLSRSLIPVLTGDEFRSTVLTGTAAGNRLAALISTTGTDGSSLLLAFLADDLEGELLVTSTPVGESFPSLTPDCLQAHLFERDICERSGIIPQGHPWLKPVRFPADSRHPHRDIGDMDFYRVRGEEIHEVAVGPVHAGVIEPGHFRFQCHGETVFHLEISLGYQHRGVERAFLKSSPVLRDHLMEAVAGDTTAGHSLAWCAVREALSGTKVSPRAQAIRGLALELERLACHIGDLGALAGDVGFLPTSSFCGRIRGDVLNMTAVLCGNRFSRGLIRPGGVLFDIDEESRQKLLARLGEVRADATGAVDLLWDTPSVLGRFEGTGKISREEALEIGLVGPATRACGLDRDIRRDFPLGIYLDRHLPLVTEGTGDVMGRARVRWEEAKNSMDFIEKLLWELPEISGSAGEPGPMAPSSLSVGLVEGWRGEICHIALTDERGKLQDYRIFDPSFHNWFGLACALRDEAISDFPLCNKSFNLSYCGFDL